MSSKSVPDSGGGDADSEKVSAAAAEPGLCDMCLREDGFQNLVLLECAVCGLQVHDDCYGYWPKDETCKEFTCWACAAVGSTVEFRERDKGTNQHKTTKITERPTACCLCSVDDGIEIPHAMHPLYDDNGMRGRQILLAAHPRVKVLGCKVGRKECYVSVPERPAWVHTLCANILTRPVSFVYGCEQDGEYECDEDGDPYRIVFDDNSSVNPALGPYTGDEPYKSSFHHYCWESEKWYSPDHPIVKQVKEAQALLKCIVCNSVDKGSYRIPVQCKAGDDDEWEAASNTHKHLGPGQTCYQAMHPGCAFFGDHSNLRRVYFFPVDPAGQGSVSSVYCTLHAKDLANHGVFGSTDVRNPSGKQRPSARRPSDPLPARVQPRGIVASFSRRQSLESEHTRKRRHRSGPSSQSSPGRSIATGPEKKKLKSEIVHDLIGALKAVEKDGPRAQDRAVTACARKWRQMVPEEQWGTFNVLFAKAREKAQQSIDGPESRRNSHDKRDPLLIDTNGLLEGLDSNTRGAAKSMIAALSDALRKVDNLDEDAAECNKTVRLAMKERYNQLNDQAFNAAWNRCKKIVGKTYGVQFKKAGPKHPRAEAAHSTEEGKLHSFEESPPPPDSRPPSPPSPPLPPQGEEDPKRPRSGSPSLARRKDSEEEVEDVANQGAPPPNQTGGPPSEPRLAPLNDFGRPRRRQISEAKRPSSAGLFDEAYYDAVQSIYQTIVENRHRPLVSILTAERERWERHFEASNVPFDHFFWSKVEKRAFNDWKVISKTEPVDWSFLDLGATYNPEKYDEYFGEAFDYAQTSGVI